MTRSSLPRTDATLPRLITTAALLGLTTGCIQLGKAGVLGFDYEARDRLLGRDGPDTALAVGGHVTLNVYSRSAPLPPPGGDVDGVLGVTRRRSAGAFELVEVTRAMSSIPEIARVDEPAGTRVRVHGVSPGATDVTVESALGGDTVTLSVAAVESATVDHWIADLVPAERLSTEVAFVQGGTGRFILSMRDASGRAVVGAGIVPPITVEPPGAVSIAPIADGDLRHAELRFDRAGPVELRMRRRDPLRLLAVDASSVESLEIVALDLKTGKIDAPSSIRVGQGEGVAVRGLLKDGHRVVLLGDVARIDSATPEVCTTPTDLTTQIRLALGDGAVAVSAVAPGVCTLVATLGSRRAELSVAVEPDKPATDKPATSP